MRDKRENTHENAPLEIGRKNGLTEAQAWRSTRGKCYFSPDIDSIIIHVETPRREEERELARIAGSIVEYTDVSAFFAAEWRAEVGKFMSGIRLHARASVWSFSSK